MHLSCGVPYFIIFLKGCQDRPTECNSDSLQMMKQLGMEVGKHDDLKVLKIQLWWDVKLCY